MMALMSSSVFYAGGVEDEADVGYAVFGAVVAECGDEVGYVFHAGE